MDNKQRACNELRDVLMKALKSKNQTTKFGFSYKFGEPVDLKSCGTFYIGKKKITTIGSTNLKCGNIVKEIRLRQIVSTRGNCYCNEFFCPMNSTIIRKYNKFMESQDMELVISEPIMDYIRYKHYTD